MAVYTPVGANDLATFLARYDVGDVTSFKGIAEGVENTNFFVATTRNRFILTLYEKRVDVGDLPWFLALLDHLAAKGLPVPGPIADRSGATLQQLNGRPACLIAFASGVSVTEPSASECEAMGRAMGDLHCATADFAAPRANALGPDGWRRLAARCGDGLDAIDPALPGEVAAALAATADWPALRSGAVHTDLFCDNVLFLEGQITGLIDFYFACTDLLAYDYAVTHAAWCFSNDGRVHYADRAAALARGYAATAGLSAPEIAALPMLGTGAALRFTLTRAYDWINTPADALVTRKDPLAFMRRMQWYRTATPAMILGR